MKRRLIIPVVLSACLICASCKAADRAEVPDLSGNITLSGRLTCEDISAEVNLEGMDRQLHLSRQCKGAYGNR